MAGLGHNSVDKDSATMFVERIERLNEEIKGIQDDRRDVFAEAKSQGHDIRALREVIKLRAMDPKVRQERQETLDVYLAAFGID